MGAGEQGWTPCVELIGFETARELHGVASVATQLALQLSRTDRRDRAQRAQAKQVEALELLGIERQLARGKRGEEFARIGNTQQVAWSRAGGGESG